MGARFEILTLCLAFGLGNAGATTQAVWNAWVIASHQLAMQSVGLLASAELMTVALVTLASAPWVGRVAPRWTIVAAALGIAAGNLLAMVPAVPALVAGRLISGLFMGVLLAVVTGLATRRAQAQRVLTLMQGTVLLTAASIFAGAPWLSRFGPRGVFPVLAGLAVAVAVLGFRRPPQAGTAVAAKLLKTRDPAGRSGVAPLLACAGFALVAAGAATLGAYFLVIGARLGFDPALTARLLALAFPLAILGPLIGHLLGERLGLLTPVMAGFALIAVAALAIVHAPSLPIFGASLAGLCTLVMFYPPYAIALVAKLDPSGRWSSAAVAFMTIGSALGPKLGGDILDRGGPAAMGWTTAALVATGAVLLLAAVAAALQASDAAGGRRL